MLGGYRHNFKMLPRKVLTKETIVRLQQIPNNCCLGQLVRVNTLSVHTLCEGRPDTVLLKTNLHQATSKQQNSQVKMSSVKPLAPSTQNLDLGRRCSLLVEDLLRSLVLP